MFDYKTSYYKMLRIRMIEEKLLEMVSEGIVFGTTHTSIGQEAISVGLSSHISENDFMFSNHRCHGHYLSYGGPLDPFLGEIMGKEQGLCGGRGGSQHLRYKRFFSNGIQGGILPNAVGLAFYQKNTSSENKNITICFIGDGTLGQGLVYESMNLASIFNLPILFIIENNQYAMSTNMRDTISGKIIDRPRSFGIESNEVSSNDVNVIDGIFKIAVDFVRNRRKPYCQIINTYRLAAHSKGDDTRESSEIDYYKNFDPLKIIENKINQKDVLIFKNQIRDEISSAIQKVLKMDDARSLKLDNFMDQIESNHFFDYELINTMSQKSNKILDLINESLDNFLLKNQSGYILGEDLRDPYGGAFKVTRGLSTKYPDQIINMPISEAAILGMGLGITLGGGKVIVEIMFGDFITLISDQVINHMTKYGWLYDLPTSNLIIRTPMGGYRGYGPTHSQSLERLFFGIPFLRMLAISEFIDPRIIFETAYTKENLPVIIIEHKLLYNKPLIDLNEIKLHTYKFIDKFYPLFHLSSKLDKAEILIISYGYAASLAFQAIKDIFYQHEVILDLLVPTIIYPLQIDTLNSTSKKYSLVIIFEESNVHGSWGDVVIGSIVSSSNSSAENRRFEKIGAEFTHIASSRDLETSILPSKDKLIKEIMGFINEQ